METTISRRKLFCRFETDLETLYFRNDYRPTGLHYYAMQRGDATSIRNEVVRRRISFLFQSAQPRVVLRAEASSTQPKRNTLFKTFIIPSNIHYIIALLQKVHNMGYSQSIIRTKAIAFRGMD